MSSPRVALINMPFANAERPSLALGLLKSLARQQGWQAEVHNFNLRFARQIGSKAYAFLCGTSVTATEHTRPLTVGMDYLVGEWLFSRYFYGPDETETADYARFLFQQADFSQNFLDAVLEIRLQVPAFIEECLGSVQWEAYAAVGFTSTFEQTMASLCLARAIKERLPHLKILLGGANCEGAMGRALARNFSFLDLVCIGEADTVFPLLLHQLEQDGAWWKVPGFVARTSAGLHENPAAPLTTDLDALPFPEFDEYFRDRELAGLVGGERGVIVETSRGCWWGKRSHCTFCGLNGGTMGFRVKSPQRALEEFRHMVSTYALNHVDYSDNILHRDYINSYLPALAREHQRSDRAVTIFYETKSNLRREELRALAAANVTFIQPGIESFDDAVLRLMGKGVRGLHNVAVLKWGRIYGINISWNLIYGFPGEPPNAYEQMAELFGRLVHLQPPQSVAPIRLDRFSPNFTQAEAKGLVEVRPKPAYQKVFHLPCSELMDLAYFFDFDYRDGRDPLTYTVALDEAFVQWEALWPVDKPVLQAQVLPQGGLSISDTRYVRPGVTHTLTPQEATLYLHFDAPHAWQTANSLAQKLGFTTADVQSYLERWDSARLIARRNDLVVGLAVMDDETLLNVQGLFPPELAIA